MQAEMLHSIAFWFTVVIDGLPSPYLTLRQPRHRTPFAEWQVEHSVFPVNNSFRKQKEDFLHDTRK